MQSKIIIKGVCKNKMHVNTRPTPILERAQIGKKTISHEQKINNPVE